MKPLVAYVEEFVWDVYPIVTVDKETGQVKGDRNTSKLLALVTEVDRDARANSAARIEKLETDIAAARKRIEEARQLAQLIVNNSLGFDFGRSVAEQIVALLARPAEVKAEVTRAE